MNEDFYQQQEKPRAESRGPLEPLDNVTETIVVSVDEANQADEEKLLKAAFKSAIGVKKKKKNKKDRRTNKTDSGEQASGDNATPDENAETTIEASENDNDKLQHLLKDLQNTHITEPAAVNDITLIRNVPTEPASHRRTRSQHANARQAQPGQYIPPSHYNYPRGGIPGPQWSHRPSFGHHGPPAPAPLPYSYRPPQFSTTFHGPPYQGQPGVFAGPPRHLFQGYQNGLYDGYNHNEQIRRWISQSTPQPVHAVPVANPYHHEVEQPQAQQEPIYVYTGASRYVSNSTIEISAASGMDSMDDASNASAPTAEQAQEIEHEGETAIEAQLRAQIQDNEKAIAEVTETLIQMDSDHDMQETEKASVAEVKAPTPATESETELVKDEPPAYTTEVTHDDEDSFIHHIVERSPAKPARRRSSIDDDLKLRFQSRPTSRAEDMVDEIEKFEDIITRSPAKPVSRIEDSVEKLDQEFDMMEALAEAASPGTSPTKGTSPVQAIPNRISSKGKTPVTPAPATKATGTLRRAATVNSRLTPTASSVGVRGGRLITSRMAAEKASAGTATVRAAKAPVLRQSVAPAAGLRRSASVASGSVRSRDTPFSSARPSAKRPLSLLTPKIAPGRQPARPPTRPTFELPGEKIARELKEKREAREARMAARDAEAERVGPMKRSESVRKMAATPMVRSSKPPTKPSFELPGDALSRKKREEHAAKLKAQEEEERKRREFKARPVRKSVVSGAPAPRETAASLARKSIVGAPSDLAIGKRSLRPSIAEIDHNNVVHSAPRTRVSSKTFERKSSTGTKPAGPSMSGLAMQRTPSNASITPATVSGATATVAGAKKLSGKEVYKRDALASQNLQQEQKAKQEAARKAREEAAERGRQASKEWAERQRLKMEGKREETEEKVTKVFEKEKFEKNRALGIKMREESTGAGFVVGQSSETKA